MPRISIPFIGGAYAGRASIAADQECVNFYAEAPPSNDILPLLIGTPGLTTFCDTGSGVQIRGLLAKGSYLYAVTSDDFYQITTAGVATKKGTLNTTFGRLTMVDNATQVFIGDGTNGYTYTPGTDTFAEVTDSDFPGALCATYLDGYIVVVEPNTARFWNSDLNDASSWDALNFATAEGAADNLVGCIANHRELWLFGSRSVELWYNAANQEGSPFSRRDNIFIETGCAAGASVAKMDNNIFWLGTSERGGNMVMRTAGYQPQRISTHAIEYIIGQYSTVSDAVGYTYEEEGHSFYVLNFPTAESTWVFDVSTELWHQRKSVGTVLGTAAQRQHRALNHVVFDRKHIVGDYTNGKIYQMSLDSYTDAGIYIRRARTTSTIRGEGQERLMFDRLEILFERGVGLEGSALGSDPVVLLSWSDDGGYTFGNKHAAKVGKSGKYKDRAIWHRLGSSRNRVFQVEMTDPVKWIIAGAWADVRSARA